MPASPQPLSRRHDGATPPAPRRTSLKSVVLLLALALSGCQSIFGVGAEENPQIVVNGRVVGMRVAEFFDRYGAPTRREEAADGTLGFNWSSGGRYMAPGPRGLEEQFCRLRLIADRSSRIVSAVITDDARGEQRFSRCVELFGSD